SGMITLTALLAASRNRSDSLRKPDPNSAKSRRYVSSTDSDRVVMVFTRSPKLHAPEEAARVPVC
nr:hypothetical protein [Tanacetum cinerariifolium]